MANCSLCGKEVDIPCGPKEHEVCPSCWLAVGASDFLCGAPDLETALEWKKSLADPNTIFGLTEPQMDLKP